MQNDTPPNPNRFEVFTELPNGKGFKIKGSKYIYFFDKYGGWYDEFNNYYNADGENDEPPSDQDDDFQRVLLEEEFLDGGDDDYYDQLYGAAHIDDDEDDIHTQTSEQQKILEAIAKNISILHDYPVKTCVRVDFFNMNFKTSKPEILKHYRQKIGNAILNVIMLQKNGSFNGEGYFVCKDVSAAEKLIKYEGEEFLGRKVFFDVQSVEDNLADPVTKDQMDIAINQEEFESLVKERPVEAKEDSKTPKKKYFSKKETKNEPKKDEEKPVEQTKIQSPKKEVKVEVKLEKEKPKQVKKEQKKEPTWGKYRGEMTMFPKKDSFREWMQTFGFKETEHFKSLTKVQSKDPAIRIATVELRSDAFETIQGKLYDNKKVQLQKIN